MDSAGFGVRALGGGLWAAGKQHYREERTLNGEWHSVNTLLQWLPAPIATVATVWRALCPLCF